MEALEEDPPGAWVTLNKWLDELVRQALPAINMDKKVGGKWET